jgi:hypothetical protein
MDTKNMEGIPQVQEKVLIAFHQITADSVQLTVAHLFIWMIWMISKLCLSSTTGNQKSLALNFSLFNSCPLQYAT